MIRRSLALVVALSVACGGDGKKVTIIPVVDEVVDAAAPTVPGAVEVSFETDDATITGSYWAPKDAANPACVVFAHQLSSTRAEYVPVIARLVGTAHLYAIDLRGHGASTKTPDGAVTWKAFTLEDWERIERDLISAIVMVRQRGGGARCVVVGASIGSSATLRLAAAAPDLVTAVVLLSPGLNYRGLSTVEAARTTRVPTLIVHSQEKGAVDAATALANLLTEGGTPVDVVADPGTAHGMKIVAGDPALLDRVVAFIAAHAR